MRTFKLCASCVLGALAATSTAAGQAPFTEEAIARGVVHVTNLDLDPMGSGVALADLDRDGDADLIAVGGAAGLLGVWENNGLGQFTDRSAGTGLPNLPRASCPTAVDYDDDGDLDLFVTQWFAPSKLFRNNGDWTFTDITASAGVGTTAASLAAAWADYNLDGWLDAYVANRTRTEGNMVRNHLWENQGDGTFVDVGGARAVDDGTAPTLVVSWLDYDRDADADLYLGTDKGNAPEWLNRLFNNDGSGGFTDVTLATGTSADVHCMGIGIGDCDHNGYQDLYVTNIPEGNKLLMANGDGTYRDETVLAGVGSYVVGWGAAFFDWDNDMTEDLYVCSMAGPDRFYPFNGVYPCVDRAADLGVVDAQNSWCMAVGDIDNDGDLDMVVQSHAANLRVYINHEGSTRNWMKLRVVGQGHNRDAIGAQVDLTAGGVTQMREVFLGSNYKSQNDFVVHFGMGAQTQADLIEVVWPGGDGRVIANRAVNATYTIYPPEYLGDLNCSGTISVSDISGFVLALTDPAGYATAYPGCAADLADLNNDGVISVSDIAAFVEQLTN